MFSNVSARWRRRLRVAVVVWAALLVVLAFAGSRATVREQVPAAEARAVMDAVVGEAASVFSGAAVLAVGPLGWESCQVTPARPGLSLTRTLQVSAATVVQVEALVERFGLRPLTSGPDGVSWSGESAGYVNVRVTATSAEPAAGRWVDPVAVQASTGCRPLDGPVGVFAPTPPFGAEASWAYGSVPCPDGRSVSSWTEAVAAEPFRVHETTGGCV